MCNRGESSQLRREEETETSAGPKLRHPQGLSCQYYNILNWGKVLISTLATVHQTASSLDTCQQLGDTQPSSSHSSPRTTTTTNHKVPVEIRSEISNILHYKYPQVAQQIPWSGQSKHSIITAFILPGASFIAPSSPLTVAVQPASTQQHPSRH